MIYEIKDTATPALQSLSAQLRRPRPLLEAAAKAVVNRLKDHFKARQGEGNRRGWPSHRFWYGVKGSVANATGVASVTDTSATVTVADHRFLHKLTGGTITPKRAKSLALPLHARAYALTGKGSIRGSGPPDLFVLKTVKGAWLVRNKEESRGKGKVARLRLEFWFRLLKRVTQAADPRALPPAGALEAAIDDAARQVGPRLLARQDQKGYA